MRFLEFIKLALLSVSPFGDTRDAVAISRHR